MNRRRAFFGGEKEPVYIFKEGEGFKANPLPGVTLLRSGGGSSRLMLELEPDYDEDGWRRDRMYIGTASGTSSRPVSWRTDFRGYKKLFVEVANEGSMGSYPLVIGLTEELDVEDYINWIKVRKYGGTERTVYEFDLSGIANSYLAAFGGRYYIVAGEGVSLSSYIYNIWLE